MTRILLPLASITLFAMFESKAQTYCVPPPFVSGPYTGILEVSIGEWENSSSFEDGYKYFDDVTPAQVTIGESYEATVLCEHTIAGGGGFSGNLNYRIWIDWNQDGDFEDDGEEVLFVDEEYYTDAQTQTFEVPGDAVPGITRMRAYNDMPFSEGHDYPDPCGYTGSTNVIGQHGEAEDYDIEVLAPDTNTEWPAGIKGLVDGNTWSVVATPTRQLVINTASLTSPFQVSAINLLGQEVYASPLYLPGKQQAVIDMGTVKAGIYFVKVQSGSSADSKKIFIH